MIAGSITIYILSILVAALVSAGLTVLVIRWAHEQGIVDTPTDPRKIHTRPIPLMGGLAIFSSCILVTALFAHFTDHVLGGFIYPRHLIAIGIAGVVIMIGGYIDDRYRIDPAYQIIAPTIAALIIISADIGIRSFTNPFGGYFKLGWDEYPVLLQPLPFILTFCWLMGMMYTTKILDGLDGLVSGISVIGALVIFGVSLRPDLQQFNVALLALIFAGACAGFLVFNFNPAKIFLGEGGSVFCGFILGVLSIIAGTKIATALLIVGIPILDFAWVLYCRWRVGGDITAGDSRHLHFRFLQAGFTQRQTVLMLYGITATFGAAAVFLQTKQKFIVLVALLGFLVFLGWWLVRRYKRSVTVC